MKPWEQSRIQEISRISYHFIEVKFESVFKVKHGCELKRRQRHEAAPTTLNAFFAYTAERLTDDDMLIQILT